MLELLSADKDYVEVNSCPKVCAPSIASHCTAVHFFLPFICFYSGWLTIVYNQRKTMANCVVQRTSRTKYTVDFYDLLAIFVGYTRGWIRYFIFNI